MLRDRMNGGLLIVLFNYFNYQLDLPITSILGVPAKTFISKVGTVYYYEPKVLIRP